MKRIYRIRLPTFPQGIGRQNASGGSSLMKFFSGSARKSDHPLVKKVEFPWKSWTSIMKCGMVVAKEGHI